MYNLPHVKQISKATVTAIDRANGKAAESNPLYEQMIEQFEMTGQWSNGATVRILDGWLRGKRTVCGLKNQAGFVVFYIIVNGRTQYQNLFTVGYYDFKTETWKKSSGCGLAEFNRWHERTKIEISKLEDKRRL